MPMFYTPKPRQFHYKPWFYDPEKEEWEKLKMKYKIEKGDKESVAATVETDSEADVLGKGDTADKDLEYFRRKVRDIDREDRQKRQKLSWKDLFRRREKPTFHYVSRFDDDGNLRDDIPSDMHSYSSTKNGEVKRRIQRRFDNEEDWDRFKPIPASKIIIATLLVCLLLFFIFS